MDNVSHRPPRGIRFIHAGLAVFGIAAFLTGELAEESTRLSAGYWLHAYLGLTLAVFLFSRLFTGLIYRSWSVSGWWHGKKRILPAIVDDCRQLLHFHLPEHHDHGGLAKLVQTFGLGIFLWMATTGAIMFIYGGTAETGLLHLVGEAHEAAGGLIPVFLVLHIGAVILHTLSGHDMLKRMNPFSR